MADKKNKPRNEQGRRRVAVNDAAAKKARAEAATWREIAEKATVDYSKREGNFTRRSAESEAQGALARGCIAAKGAAKAWEAAAEKWKAGDRERAEHFEEEANAAMMDSLDGLDKADDLWEMEQEEKSTSQGGTKTPWTQNRGPSHRNILHWTRRVRVLTECWHKGVSITKPANWHTGRRAVDEMSWCGGFLIFGVQPRFVRGDAFTEGIQSRVNSVQANFDSVESPIHTPFQIACHIIHNSKGSDEIGCCQRQDGHDDSGGFGAPEFTVTCIHWDILILATCR